MQPRGLLFRSNSPAKVFSRGEQLDFGLQQSPLPGPFQYGPKNPDFQIHGLLGSSLLESLLLIAGNVPSFSIANWLAAISWVDGQGGLFFSIFMERGATTIANLRGTCTGSSNGAHLFNPASRSQCNKHPPKNHKARGVDLRLSHRP